ncbi:MAG: N-acetyltransferase family protein [Parvularcula sp.]
MPGVTVMAAQPADVPDLVFLGRQTFSETFGHLYTEQDLALFLEESHSEAVYAHSVAAADTGVWIARDEAGVPLAYCVAGPNGIPAPNAPAEAGELKRLYVRAEGQGRGLGTQLLQIGLDWLRAQGFAPLYISVFSENLGAQRLYAAYGFSKVGEYKYMVGTHADREFIFCDTPDSGGNP